MSVGSTKKAMEKHKVVISESETEADAHGMDATEEKL
jgi:hypothetical protein